MTEGTESRHESGTGSKTRFTPRKAKPDAGSTKQTTLRGDIARSMRNEMLVCYLDDFLERLSPFSPHAQWIDCAYEHLKAKRLLGTQAETTVPVKPTAERTTKNSRKAAATAVPPRQEVHEANVGNADTVQWEAYRDVTPECMEKNEMRAFKPLQDIVEALHDCPDPNSESNSKRKLNGYRYKNCPSSEMASEIQGADFKLDAVIANPNIYKRGSKSIPLAAAQTAVVMEFKKKATREKIYENRKQLVSAANHIMNDDPRRNWMYGITIENTNMSLWYFSRSYSMKSASFDFTKDFKMFIRVFLSFLYATEKELGYDPSIFQEYYEEEWCYIYKLKTTEGTKYYRTIEPLYNSRSYCITGRKSRVWKVVQVTGPKDLAPIHEGREAALKDCWVDEGSLSEKEIQTDIFDRLKAVKETDYSWAPIGLQENLKTGIACPEAYFMKVIWDWKLGVNKERPESKHDPFLLTDSMERSAAKAGKVIASSHTPPGTAYPFPRTSNTSAPVSAVPQIPPAQRDYKVKQHYRVVYADVGESLAYATSLSDAVRAFEDIFVALTLLFLAGWVHRDVSEGNIILVRDEHGVRAKLNDLEYARSFNPEDGAASTDPKTGTPYFMPVEVHKGETLLFNPPPATLDVFSMTSIWKRNQRRPEPTSPSVRYNFAYDMESLWWIIVWIVLRRIKGAPWLDQMIFAVFDFPHPDREAFFRKGDALQAYLEPLIHDSLCERHAHTFLAIYNHSLLKFYSKGERQKAASYHKIYSPIWDVMEIFVRKMSDVKMELEDPDTRVPPWLVSLPGSQEIGKRLRSREDDDSAAETGEDSSSRKKQKSDADRFEDTDEKDTTEEDTAEDMAGITREDSNPRITIRAT